MDLSHIDRNRMTVAFVATALLLTGLFLSAGGSSDPSKDSAEPATTTTYDLGLATGDTVDAPANLDGPVSQDPNGQGQIAYPADNDGQIARGSASYKRFPESSKTGCATNLVPLGTVLTVLNLNNGRKTTCTNINIGPTSGTFDIILNTAIFESIAELVDAPIPVELTW
jgi:rare lipoprotein A (peptidoglycan hydrolase)